MAFKALVGGFAGLLVIGAGCYAMGGSKDANLKEWGNGAAHGAFDIIEGLIDAIFERTGGRPLVLDISNQENISFAGYVAEDGTHMFIQNNGEFSNQDTGFRLSTDDLKGLDPQPQIAPPMELDYLG